MNKMEKEEHSLLYHALHSRPMAGCLPLFFLLAAIAVGSALLFVKVEMPRGVRPEGLGKAMFINDATTATRLKLRSPLPLILPAYVDPTRRETAAGQTLPRKAEPKLQPPPPSRIFSPHPTSMILDEDALLKLPEPAQPESGEQAPSPTRENDREESPSV